MNTTRLPAPAPSPELAELLRVASGTTQEGVRALITYATKAAEMWPKHPQKGQVVPFARKGGTE